MMVEHKVVIISGARCGLGRVAAKRFVQHGARLALIGTNMEKLKQLATELDLSNDQILSLAQETKGSGITANILLVKTIDIEHARDQKPDAKNAGWTTPEEITATLLYPSTEEASVITGARIPLNGG